LPSRRLHHIELHSDQAYASPFFDVAVTGHFEGPDGACFSHPAFHDGEGTWRLRIAPGRPGRWTWRTTAVPANPDLEQAGTLEVADEAGRGFLRSVPGSPSGFRFENGEDIWPCGDTTYDLFGMDYCGGDVEGFVTRRAAQGYTHLRIRVPVSRFHPPASHCLWQTRRCWPWGGSEQAPRFDLMNLDWFREVDATVERIDRAGLGIEMIMQAWGFEFPFNHRTLFTPEYEQLWMRYLIARYDAYACVWFWTPLNEYEYHNNGDWNWSPASDAWAVSVARWIKATAAHGHPVAMHNGPVMPPFAERFRADPTAVDTIMFQHWGGRGPDDGWLATGIEDQIARSLDGWPGTAIFAEWGYEQEDGAPRDFPGFEYCDRSHNRRGGWRGAFSGVPIANGFEDTWSPRMNLDRDLPGVADLAHVRTFMTALMADGRPTPAPELVEDDRGAGLRPLALRAGAGCAVYLPAGGGARLRLGGEWRLRWFDPRTGTATDPEAVAADALLTLTDRGGTDAQGRPEDWVAQLTPQNRGNRP
jgi:hypothetical protein